MNKIISIKSRKIYSRVYKKGKSFVSPVLVTYILKNNNDNLQIGITTTKKIGNAVQRSRCRRIIRAAYSNIDAQMNPGYFIIFVARTKTKELKSTDLISVMKEHLQMAGVL